MDNVKNIAETPAPRPETTRESERPQISLVRRRWTQRSRSPRLVSFSWGAVEPARSHR